MRTLQKKFVLSTMLAITILLVILLGAINIGNLCVSERQSRQMIGMLLDEETMRQPPPRNHAPKGIWDAPMDENSRMSAVYFAVRVDQRQSIRMVDIGRIAGISEDEAANICREVMETGKSEGRIQSFRYQTAVDERDQSTVYLFLDTSAQIRNIVRVLLFSAASGMGCWLAMLLLVVLISKKAIRPIAENLLRQKQFVTDAGHEIKTPLAIIQANAEAMELYQGESKWSRNIREQTERLNGLMQNLLALAKADENRDLGTMEAVQLSDVVARTLAMFAESMRLKELDLHTQIAPSVRVKANLEQIQRLVSILTDNAVKYANAGGELCVLLECRAKAVVFRIENTCAALPDCPPEKLFDRFYRADAARTQESGGYGIGLSAAKTIAGLYGGSITASYHTPNRIAFTVTFPETRKSRQA